MKEQVALRSTTRDETSCTPSITIMAAENLEVQVIGYIRDQVILWLYSAILISQLNENDLVGATTFNSERLETVMSIGKKKGEKSRLFENWSDFDI